MYYPVKPFKVKHNKKKMTGSNKYNVMTDEKAYDVYAVQHDNGNMKFLIRNDKGEPDWIRYDALFIVEEGASLNEIMPMPSAGMLLKEPLQEIDIIIEEAIPGLEKPADKAQLTKKVNGLLKEYINKEIAKYEESKPRTDNADTEQEA